MNIKCCTWITVLKYVSDAFEEKYEELKADKWADEEDVMNT